MIKKILLISVACVLAIALKAQVSEELSDLEYNARQYYASKKYTQTRTHKYLVDKGVTIVHTDTLSLPFVDDFSTNELRSSRWVEQNITDTFYNVFGTCLGNEGIITIDSPMLNATAWHYFNYDSVNHTFDSVALAPDTFTFFGPSTSGCFTQTPQTFFYWHPYYRYFYNDSSGIDSVLIDAPLTTISYAPVIYFAQGEPGTLWFDNYAYVNNTYPINPPTIGVATLDGLNEYGLPYNNVIVNAYGSADVLTSLPIQLQGLSESDSVYLSFLYQPGGLGDYPDKFDSLLLELKDNSGQWHTVWSDTGYTSPAAVPNRFLNCIVGIPTLPVPLNFYHNTFQFRFRNKASLYGNNDHWHIDYVRLDKQRFSTDTNILDIAFIYPITTILKNFTLMPADQFIAPVELADSVSLTIRNLDRDANSNPPATNFVKGAEQLYPNPSVVAPNSLQTFNASDYNFLEINPGAEYTITTAQTPVDSMDILSVVFINPNDALKTNDTLKHLQRFNSVMAYDDGSAEKSYGLTGLGLKKFAYEFNLNFPDTLAAFQVHFAQVDVKVNDLVFNFYAWDSLQLNTPSFIDSPIFTLDNKKPLYVDSVNGFATYKLDTPLVITDKIYFGWAQTDDRRLQIGYDLNSTLGRPHMYIYRNSVWQKSTITPAGSPMIRLIFDTDFWGGSTSFINLTEKAQDITLYPNPTWGNVFIESELDNSIFDISVYNLFGQLVKQLKSTTNQIDIGELLNGVYLLHIRETQTGKVYHKKIVKTSF